jgi:hypothetical protein
VSKQHEQQAWSQQLEREDVGAYTLSTPSPKKNPPCSRATVPFASPEAADVVCRAVSVDPELRAGHVRREMRTEGSTLIM